MSFPATELSRWMDTFDEHIGGLYHRAQHGHDFVANVDIDLADVICVNRFNESSEHFRDLNKLLVQVFMSLR